MNPSASGWIKKLLKELKGPNDFLQSKEEEIYVALRQSGFIYGSNIRVVKDVIKKNDLTADEICKVNLFLALLHTYQQSGITLSPTKSLINFYSEINKQKTSFSGIF